MAIISLLKNKQLYHIFRRYLILRSHRAQPDTRRNRAWIQPCAAAMKTSILTSSESRVKKQSEWMKNISRPLNRLSRLKKRSSILTGPISLLSDSGLQRILKRWSQTNYAKGESKWSTNHMRGVMTGTTPP